jgi:hypothetical protein
MTLRFLSEQSPLEGRILSLVIVCGNEYPDKPPQVHLTATCHAGESGGGLRDVAIAFNSTAISTLHARLHAVPVAPQHLSCPSVYIGTRLGRHAVSPRLTLICAHVNAANAFACTFAWRCAFIRAHSGCR